MTDKTHLHTSYRAIRIAVNLAIVAVLAVIFILKERFDLANAYERERADTSQAMSGFADAVMARMNRILLVGRGFSGAVALKPEFSQADFARYAATVLSDEEAVVNVAVIRGGVIEFVYPYGDNADLVGADLRAIPEQWAVAEAARESGKSILQGPIPLLQGIDGYILREPLFINAGPATEYWGLMSVVFSAEKFFEGLGISELGASFDMAIRSLDSGAPVAGDPGLFATDALTRRIEVPGAGWELAAIPRGGWQGGAGSRDLFLLFFATAVIVLAIANYLFNQREEALSASEKLQAAVDVLADGFVLFDREDRLVLCNQRYRDIYGASAPAIVPGARFEDILRYGLERGQYKAAQGREEEWLTERLRAHRSAEYVLVQELDDGRWLRVREMATPDGGRVGIRVDITDQVNSRERAEIAEMRLRDAIDAMPASFWLFDPNERLEIENGRAFEAFPQDRARIQPGVTLEEAVRVLAAREWPGATGEETGQRSEHLLRLMRKGASEFEIRVGENQWVKLFSHRTNEGGLVCFGVDISELMLHERWLQQSNTRLRAALKERDVAEGRLADFGDVSSEWFWEQDAERRLTYISPGFERATGVPVEDVVGRMRDDLLIEDVGSDSEGRETISEKVAARERFEGFIYRSNIRAGDETWFRTSGKPVYDAEGRFKGYVGAAADVSQLYAALRVAKRADEAKTQFLNVISHELRTPMTIVLGFNAFLTNIETLPEIRRFRERLEDTGQAALEPDFLAAITQVKRFAEKIQAAGDQLQHLIQDMLDLARIEANTMHIEVARVPARKVVDSLVSQMQPMAKEKGIAIVGDVDEVDIKCDETRLRQILINLISNALKFTDAGTISVRTETGPELVVFHVEDTGVGIPEEALPLIFDRFTQVDISSTRNQGGAGLGLSISKELVALQGGTISATSVEGKGTCVTFTLPRWSEAQVA
ncbi:PAS-domain containing protein [Sinisalibacter aestuarii]|uniref:histidine kinase n=1 Tax=Sinisalibacter aestuarii TaxID=2949426 RepID=A0ABQ5LTE1_9RHOB|nr:PAS-domain containing protein [Sinisalibacter aestuarii]GKY87367.1 hypothetical protein STA1M1_12360 [Sinisalibacter aestuarii]